MAPRQADHGSVRFELEERMARWLWGVAWLVGCSGGDPADTDTGGGGAELTIETFAEQFFPLFCAYDQSCDGGSLMGYASAEECEADLLSGMDSGTSDDCDFDATAAQACLDAMEGLECEGMFENLPSACSEVCVESDTDL